MTTQLCFNQSEAVELHGPHGLYLKPIAKLNISVTLPQMKLEGKSISNWEVMEKLKRMAKPDSFLVLRVSKSSLEFLRFEAEVEAKSLIKVLILRLDGKLMKLSGFPEPLKVRAAEAKISFPNRHDWDSFFRDAKNMNENNPGERPDTVKIENMPCKWFSTTAQPDSPSEHIVKKIFEFFGEVRNVDIPMLDPYRHESQVIGGNFRTFSSFNILIFDVYVQYAEYIGFVKAMDALKGMKLMKKERSAEDEEGKEGKAYTADIKVDFDKTRHLSAKSIKKREKERQRLMQLEKEREEQKRLEREEAERKAEEERRRKEQEELLKMQRKQAKLTRREERRQQREEKRRQLREERKRIRQEQELQRRIALEERKLLIALRQLESIRLLTELFERVKVIKQQEEVQQRLEELERERLRQIEEERRKKEAEEHRKEKEEAQRKRELKRRELRLKRKLTKNLETREQLEEERRREHLRQKLGGKAKLKSAVIPSKYPRPHIDDCYYEYGKREDFSPVRKQKLKSAITYKRT